MYRKKFLLFDLYKSKGIVNCFDTLEEANAGYLEYEQIAKGKCELLIMEWNDTLFCYQVIRQYDI